MTTNQPGSHQGRQKWSFINGPICILRYTSFLRFLLPIWQYQFALVLQLCSPEVPPWHHPQPTEMLLLLILHRSTDPGLVFHGGFQKPGLARAHYWFQSADGKNNLVLIYGKTKLLNTGDGCPVLTLFQHLRDQRGLCHMQVKVSFWGLTAHKEFPQSQRMIPEEN